MPIGSVKSIETSPDSGLLESAQPYHQLPKPALRTDLIRSPKVLQQLSEPEVFGGHAGLATRVLRLQRQNPGRGIAGQGIDGRGLSVGGYQPLEFAPELIHRAQFGRLPGQPHEADPQPVCQRLGLRGGVGAGPVGQKPEPAALS